MSALESPQLVVPAPQLGNPRRIAVLIGARGIEAASQCVPYVFEHGREGMREGAQIKVVAKRWPGGVCARGLSPHEEIFSGMMEGAVRVDRSASGGVRLSGPAGTVTLRCPEGGAVANPFGNMPAPGPELLWGHFRVVEVGGVAPAAENPIDVAVGRLWIEARSGCLPFRWRMVRSGPGLSLTEDWPDPVCEQGLNPSEQAMERVMPAVRRFDWIVPYRVRLSGPAGSVTLARVRTDGRHGRSN